MGLPTAQLGSPASLNVPSSIPTVGVQKDPKMWEKMLLTILTQAAGDAVGAGVNNVMSRDYAPEFGKTSATGFDKLVSGPTVGEKQASQLRSEKSTKEGQMRGIAADAQTTKFKALQDMLAQTQNIEARTTSEGLANNRLDAEIASRENLAGMADRGDAAKLQANQLMEEIKGVRAAKENRLDRSARQPLLDAETKKYSADAANQEITTQFMKKALASGDTTAKGQPTSAVKNHATAQSAPMSSDIQKVADILSRAAQPAPAPDPTTAINQFSPGRPQDELLKLLAQRLGISSMGPVQ